MKSLLLGFLAGGIAAGISTLLTAPASGKETRQYLKENKDQWLDQLSLLKNNLIELKDAAAFATKEGKEAISTFASDIKSAVAEWKSEVWPHQLELKREIQEIENTVKDLEFSLNSSNQIRE